MNWLIYATMFLLTFRHDSLVVSMLDFQSGGWWIKPGLCHHVVSLDKTLYSTLSLSTQLYKWVVSLDKKLYSTLSLLTQVYKWVPVIVMLGVTLQWTSIPSWGSTNIPTVASCYRNQKPASLMGLITDLAYF